MANFPVLASGQQAVTTGAAALPATAPAPPAGAISGQGLRVTLGCTKASTASLFYGPSGVTPTTGKEVPAGTSDTLFVNDTSQIFVVAVANSTATATWSATNIG